MDDLVSRLIRELPDTAKNRYDIAYRRGRAQARSSLLFGGLIAGFAGGMLTMFLLDPERGRSRRAEVGQRMTGLRHDLERTAEGRGKDLRNRAAGAAHELHLPGTAPTNEERRAAIGVGDRTDRPVQATPRSAGAQLRRTDQQVDDASIRVGAAAGTIRSDEEARGV
jgi:hypothetical protein